MEQQHGTGNHHQKCNAEKSKHTSHHQIQNTGPGVDQNGKSIGTLTEKGIVTDGSKLDTGNYTFRQELSQAPFEIRTKISWTGVLNLMMGECVCSSRRCISDGDCRFRAAVPSEDKNPEAGRYVYGKSSKI